MEIISKMDGSIEIRGIIKTIEDVENIKNAIENYSTGNIVDLIIVDSFAMPSALIGYLIKLKSLQKKDIRLKVGDENLYELLRDLNLEKEFNLQKIEKD